MDAEPVPTKRNALWKGSPIPQAPSTIISLPSDALELISSYFPAWPRLSVLSLVCKRWRSVVLNSVTSLNLFRGNPDRPPMPSYTSRLASLFPSLTEIYIPAHTKSIPPLPRGLRNLLHGVPQLDVLQLHLQARSLTQLTLFITSTNYARNMISIISASALTLRSITLNISNFAFKHQPFLHLRLPQLDSLIIRTHGKDMRAVEAVVGLFAAQLTHLELDVSFNSPMASLSRLTSLYYTSGQRDYSPPVLKAPLRTGVCLWAELPIHRIQHFDLAPKLWSYETRHMSHLTKLLSEIPVLPQLRSLHLTYWGTKLEQQLDRASFPALTTCVISRFYSRRCVAVMTTLGQLLRAAPNLRTVMFGMPPFHEQIYFYNFTEWLRMAESQGVQLVDVSYQRSSPVAVPVAEDDSTIKSDWFAMLMALVPTFRWLKLRVRDSVWE